MSKKRQKRSAQVDVLCFFAALQDVGLLEMSCFSSMVSSISGTSSERFLTITFRISSVKYRVYFLVICLFFPRSRIDFQKKLHEKHKKINVMPLGRMKGDVFEVNFSRVARCRTRTRLAGSRLDSLGKKKKPEKPG